MDMPPVDDIICAGDIVGYNPWPRGSVEHVRSVSSIIIQGNHDRNVGIPYQYEHNDVAHAGLEIVQKALTNEQREWLAELPRRTEFAGDDYRLVHSNLDPDKLGSYVRPAEFPKMRPYLNYHVGIVLGHTHIQHKATIGGRLIVNPGSVGQPRDGDELAAYAVLDTAADEVEFRRVEYDINWVVFDIEEHRIPAQTRTRLLDDS